MKRFLKAIVYVVLLFVIGIIAGHLTFKALSFSRTVDVPDLKGKGMVEANRLLKEKGLYIRLEGEEHDASVPEGSIVRQDVPSGNKVKEGREIKIVVSKGPRVKYVPDVVGLTLSEAEAQLMSKKIHIKRIVHVHSDKAPRDTILAQRPEANEQGGDAFSVVVSLGSPEE